MQVVITSNPPGRFQPVNPRQRKVHQNNVRALAQGQLDGLFAILRLNYTIAVMLKLQPHEVARILDVFDQ